MFRRRTAMSTTVAPELVVTLKYGFVVSLPALQTLWSLEDRGLLVRVDGDALVVRPRSRITPDDDRAIREHRVELMALVRNCEAVQ
jgi:hypothetical protein